MPTTIEAPRLNLDFYRKQARALLKSAQSGEAAALERIKLHAVSTRRDSLTSSSAALNDAQRAIAQEQRFPNWNRFRQFVLASSADALAPSEAFVNAAMDDLGEAQRILGAHPEVVGSGIAAALVLGDSGRLQRLLRLSPETLLQPIGIRNWAPLLYVCFSRFASSLSDRRKALTELGTLLLKHGADPNGFYVPEQWPDNPLPCLFGATGLNNNPELAEALIDAGANLDDKESLYHSTEHADHACMRLLLERGASASVQPNVLLHVLEREDITSLQLLLEYGADPNARTEHGETALHWAVWRTRGAEIITELLRNGVEINAVRDDGRTAYALAYRSGQTETAALLEANGADTVLLPVDRFAGECATASEEHLRTLTSNLPDLRSDPSAIRILPDLAMCHRTAAVRAVLDAGADIDARGESGATALHWACWYGFSDIAETLIERGASLTIQDEEFHGPPPGWFGHGIHYCPDRSGDWYGVAQALISVGAEIPAVDLPTGVPQVDDLLREHGIIRD